MRAGDIIQRLLAKRDPEKDSYMNIARALGYKSISGVTNMLTRDDVCVSTLYKLCKYFGYIIVVMNPADPSGKSDMVVTMKHQPLPLTNQEGKTVKGRPRRRKFARNTQRDRYKGLNPTRPVVLQSCRVKKKTESKAG